MRKTLTVLAISAAISVVALAGSWSGKLIDAACYDQSQKVDSCDASGQTATFALAVAGKVFKLDDAGNAKAMAALKNRADRANPNQPQSTEVVAKISGTAKGGVITVESIDVQ